MLKNSNSVKSNNLYKQRNDLEKNQKIEENNLNIQKRKNVIYTILTFLIIIGFANYYSAISRFGTNIIIDKVLKYFLILGVSLFMLFCTLTIFKKKTFYMRLGSPKIRSTLLFLAIITFLIVAYAPFKNVFPTVNGGKGWIRFANFSFQITELFKILFIISLASILGKFKETKAKKSYWWSFASVCFYTLIYVILIAGPLKDLGTALHYILIATFLLFISDMPNKFLLPAASSLIIAVVAISIYVHEFASGYKAHRLQVFLKGLIDNEYSRTEAFQIYQSLLGFGTAGLFGKGYGNGIQKYNYIPEVETDFAIATFGEEFGFFGLVLLLITFFTLFLLIMNISENAKDYFSKYLAAGIGGYFIIQVIINIGVAIGLIPVLGIPLPFISSGGSSLMTLLISMALVIVINNSKLEKI